MHPSLLALEGTGRAGAGWKAASLLGSLAREEIESAAGSPPWWEGQLSQLLLVSIFTSCCHRKFSGVGPSQCCI